MPRTLTSSMQAEAAKAANEPLHLFEAHFDSGVVRANDGYRVVEWDGNTYQPNGYFLGFEGIEEDVGLGVPQVTVSLSGVDQSLVATVLVEDYLDRRLVIYKAFMLDGNLVADPVALFDGRMDAPVISEDPQDGSCVIMVSASSHWGDFDRRICRRSNDAIQRQFFPDDGFFKFCSEFAGRREIIWGRPPAKPPVAPTHYVQRPEDTA